MDERLANAGVATGRDVVVQIEPRLISLEVGARVYGLSADVLAEMQDNEGLPIIRRGRRRLIPVAQADEYFAARVTRSAS